MTTANPPSVLKLPTVAEIREAINMDRWVAITAIVVAGCVACFLIRTLGDVAAAGGEMGTVALSISAAVATVVGAMLRIFPGGKRKAGSDSQGGQE